MGGNGGNELSAGEVMLATILEDSHSLHPDDLARTVRRKARIAGLDDVRIYVADKQQRYLTPFPVGTDPSLEIDRTVAGRAFRRSETIPVDDLAWFPLLDGAHRVGVMSAVLREPGAISLRRGKNLATLVTYLLVTKSNYGDAILRAKRREVLDLAAEMRWAIAPPLTFASDRVAVSGFLEPAYQVAGDAFDYAVNGDTLHIAVFDAMGHGLAASRLCNLAVMSYRNSRRRGYTLEEVYRRMDEVVADQFGFDFFVTAQFVTLDIPTGRVRWINAGHPAPIVLRRRSTNVQLPTVTVPPVGLCAGDVAATETSLEPGDLVLFHSDGVIEARDPEGEEFGRDRLADLLVRAAAADETVPETVRRLGHAVLDHQQGVLDDDATLVLLHWPGTAGASGPLAALRPMD